MINEYIVDLSKPPIWPPGREFKTGIFGGEAETKESVKLNLCYDAYLARYANLIACMLIHNANQKASSQPPAPN